MDQQGSLTATLTFLFLSRALVLQTQDDSEANENSSPLHGMNVAGLIARAITDEVNAGRWSEADITRMTSIVQISLPLPASRLNEIARRLVDRQHQLSGLEYDQLLHPGGNQNGNVAFLGHVYHVPWGKANKRMGKYWDEDSFTFSTLKEKGASPEFNLGFDLHWRPTEKVSQDCTAKKVYRPEELELHTKATEDILLEMPFNCTVVLGGCAKEYVVTKMKRLNLKMLSVPVTKDNALDLAFDFSPKGLRRIFLFVVHPGAYGYRVRDPKNAFNLDMSLNFAFWLGGQKHAIEYYSNILTVAWTQMPMARFIAFRKREDEIFEREGRFLRLEEFSVFFLNWADRRLRWFGLTCIRLLEANQSLIRTLDAINIRWSRKVWDSITEQKAVLQEVLEILDNPVITNLVNFPGGRMGRPPRKAKPLEDKSASSTRPVKETSTEHKVARASSKRAARDHSEAKESNKRVASDRSITWQSPVQRPSRNPSSTRRQVSESRAHETEVIVVEDTEPEPSEDEVIVMEDTEEELPEDEANRIEDDIESENTQNFSGHGTAIEAAAIQNTLRGDSDQESESAYSPSDDEEELNEDFDEESNEFFDQELESVEGSPDDDYNIDSDGDFEEELDKDFYQDPEEDPQEDPSTSLDKGRDGSLAHEVTAIQSHSPSKDLSIRTVHVQRSSTEYQILQKCLHSKMCKPERMKSYLEPFMTSIRDELLGDGKEVMVYKSKTFNLCKMVFSVPSGFIGRSPARQGMGLSIDTSIRVYCELAPYGQVHRSAVCYLGRTAKEDITDIRDVEANMSNEARVQAAPASLTREEIKFLEYVLADPGLKDRTNVYPTFFTRIGYLRKDSGMSKVIFAQNSQGEALVPERTRRSFLCKREYSEVLRDLFDQFDYQPVSPEEPAARLAMKYVITAPCGAQRHMWYRTNSSENPKTLPKFNTLVDILDSKSYGWSVKQPHRYFSSKTKNWYTQCEKRESGCYCDRYFDENPVLVSSSKSALHSLFDDEPLPLDCEEAPVAELKDPEEIKRFLEELCR